MTRIPVVGVLVLTAALAGCHGAALALAPTQQQARADAYVLLGALASRFGPVDLEPAFAALRPRLARASLAPSRIWDDSVWGRPTPELRTLVFVGRRSGAGYRIGLSGAPVAPSAPSDYRGRLELRRLRADDYEWTMHEALAVGSVTAEGLSRALTEVLAAAASLSEAEAHARLAGDLPRASAAFGRALDLDRLALATRPDGATDIVVLLRVDPAGLRPSFPSYARFLERNALAMQGRASARDDTGARWWEGELAAARLSLRLRVREGSLVPLDGLPRRIPPRISVTLDFSTKSGLFRVGFRKLETEVTLVRERRHKGLRARFRTPPEWALPFFVKPLLQAPLKRPFEGEGAELSYGLRDNPGEPTLLIREYRIAVRESWVVRWLGGVTDSIVGEFRREAEAEADRFSGECFEALRGDLAALLRSPS